MAPHHELFKAFAPIDWDSIPSDSLGDFLADIFLDAQTVIDSIPVPAAASSSSSSRRARAHTDPPLPSAAINRALSARQSGAALSHAQDLMKEWKEVKVNPRENPFAINVYKLAAKDGRGSWFARRSVHDGLTFEKWKLGLEREFAESMKVQAGPGGGSIRGIGADKRAEHHLVDSVGKAEVFHLSAQFPGPTAPRDFVTLLLSSDASHKPPQKGEKRPLRSFMILSKPCQHPDCPTRQGYIRGQYESVEIIREVPSDNKPVMRRARSSVEVSREDSKNRQSVAGKLGKEAVLRAAAKKVAENNDDQRKQNRGLSADSAPALEQYDGADGNEHNGEEALDEEEDDDVRTTIEWLMVTRSDPGGNVPRFMIERGTPGGIVSDAGKFLKWLTAKSARDFERGDSHHDGGVEDDEARTSAVVAEETKARTKNLAAAPTSNLLPNDGAAPCGGDGGDYYDDGHGDPRRGPEEQVPSSNGLYGIISGAFGLASSAVSGRLPSGFPGFLSGTNSSAETIAEDRRADHADSVDLNDESDTSSVHSFTSAVERNGLGDDDLDASSTSNANHHNREHGSASIHSTESSLGQQQQGSQDNQRNGNNNNNNYYDREIKKLQDRRQKALDKMSKLQGRMSSKRAEDSQKDTAALAKLREKHAREAAKHEDRYRREVARLERKRESDERKAEEKRRKQAEREEKASLGAELDKTRVERDLARAQVEMLKARVGELQGENTMLVREIGKLGVVDGPGDGDGNGEARRPKHNDKRNSVSELLMLKRADSTLSSGSAVVAAKEREASRSQAEEGGKVAGVSV